MHTKLLVAGLFGLTIAAGALLTGPASAETVSYTAALLGSQEVPPTTSKGTGAVEASYDTVTKKLAWKVSYSGLSGPPTAAHFHGPAEVGKNASVVVPLAAKDSPMEGSATLTDAQATELAAGKWYVNIHTAAIKSGEIRGQVVKK